MSIKIYNSAFTFFALIISLLFSNHALAQCNENNATGCSCPTPGTTNCLLLPDILAGKKTLNSTAGWTEYNQAITNVNKGLLRLDVSTPNVGWGPLQVAPTDDYVCGTDTLRNFFPPPSFLCPDGSYPKRLIKQKIYQKPATACWVFYVMQAGCSITLRTDIYILKGGGCIPFG